MQFLIFLSAGVKIGGEFPDEGAGGDHGRTPVRRISGDMVEDYFASGADIVDLGFGFDATPEDVDPGFFPS